MILQTKASILAALLATDGGRCSNDYAVHRPNLVVSEDARAILTVSRPHSDIISNDRTDLDHQK